MVHAVKQVMLRNNEIEEDLWWFMFGDDDTVFFVNNIGRTLAKYDHSKWLYIGSNSESYEQNVKYSFEMAFGDGSFIINSSVARSLARFWTRVGERDENN